MSDVTIYHNPRCSKSRETLALLEEQGVDPSVIRYLDDPPDAAALRELCGRLGIAPRELVRDGEKLFRERYKGKDLDDDGWLAVMAAHPVLIQRPIVVRGDRAVLGRPPGNALELLR